MIQLLENLNDQQKKAVLHQDGPAIVLAGAGSGKTTVLTSRAAWLLGQKATEAHNLLVVTFTNKAAGEVKERILNLTGSSLPFAGTFHSLCAKILRRDGQAINLHPNFTIYDTEDQLKLFKNIYAEQGFDKNMFQPKAVANAISQAKNETLTPNQYAELASNDFQSHVARVYKLYQQVLTKSQAVDFDDLLLKALFLIQQNETVRKRYQDQFTHVLVDEYQDTNTVQYSLTKLLSQPHQNLYVVGDFSQSIYAWRGADYRNMMQLKKDFDQITEYRLEQNYRSTQNILDAATAVISHNTSHPILELWTNQEKSQPITVFEARDAQEEAWQAVRYIRDNQSLYKNRDMAILYRTNAQSRAFEEALISSGIPYQIVGGTNFYERKEIKDVLAYLKYLVNQFDTISYQRLASLGKKRLANYELWLTTKTRESLIFQPPALLLKTVLKITNYLDKYSQQTEEHLARRENIVELLGVATQFSSTPQFLENVALIQNDHLIDQITNQEIEKDKINLMSLHAAKGLEFEVVLMVGLEDGLLPHQRSLFDKEEMEEERRLCYVGITRAKSCLYLLYARNRFQYGTRTNALRSRFISDIPKDLINLEGGSLETDLTEQSGHKSERRLVAIDDDILDGVISGEFNIDRLLE